MERKDGHVEISEEEASGGVKQHNVRYVLGISLVLAIIAMSAAWIIPAVAM